MIDWNGIETVLLDMDGTLLDLHFDNYSWLEHLPRRYAEIHDRAQDEARAALIERFRLEEGSLNWYCVDYWSRELGLDIPLLKAEVDHLIAVHPHVTAFLDAVRARGTRTLVTNAHGRAIALKFRKTQPSGHFDAVVSAHDLGLPKEDARFWEAMQAREPFHRERALLVDDSLPVLRSARSYGVAV